MRAAAFRIGFVMCGALAIGFAPFGCLRELTCDEKAGLDCATYPGGGSGGDASSGAGNGGSGPGGTSSGSSGAGGTSSGGGGTTAGSGASGGGSGGSAGGASGEGGGAGAGGSEPCDGACGGGTPVCNESTNECVECTEEEAGACSGGTPHCDASSQSCVQCLENRHCADPLASRCNAGICVPCTASPDCAHINGKKVCDTTANECVECTVADESACGPNSCNPETKRCTTTPRGSVSQCKPCLADSECTGGNQPDPDFRCVPMHFMSVPRPGGFCLRRVAKTCGRPYTIGFAARSLSGAPEENYCGIDQQNVRCEAVLDLIDSRTCPGGANTLCGCARDDDGNCTASGQGGLCRNFVALNEQCTYQCGSVNHCPSGYTCTGTPTMYCQ